MASWTRQSKIVKKGRIDINAELKEGMITKAISSMDFCRQLSASETPNQEKETRFNKRRFCHVFLFYVHQLAKNLCSFVVCSTVTRDFGLARKTTGYWDIHRSQMKV